MTVRQKQLNSIFYEISANGDVVNLKSGLLRPQLQAGVSLFFNSSARLILHDQFPPGLPFRPERSNCVLLPHRTSSPETFRTGCGSVSGTVSVLCFLSEG